MTTRILLIRHAAIDAASRLCGWLDVPLSPAGLAQIATILHQGPTHPAPQALYASTLTRAWQVAAVLGRRWALEPRHADWAREIHCGHLEGIHFAQLQHRYPELWARNEAQNDDSFGWPGGETYIGFRARVLAGLTTAAANHPGERVAVVTHAGVISQVLGAIGRRPPPVWAIDRPDPLTATEVTWSNGAPAAVVTYNDPHWY